MPTDKDEAERRLREELAKRDALPDDQRTQFKNPDRFIGDPIGVDNQGKPTTHVAWVPKGTKVATPAELSAMIADAIARTEALQQRSAQPARYAPLLADLATMKQLVATGGKPTRDLLDRQLIPADLATEIFKTDSQVTILLGKLEYKFKQAAMVR